MSIDNPWWITSTIPEDYKRMPPRTYLNEFYPLVEDSEIRRAVILMGPRHVHLRMTALRNILNGLHHFPSVKPTVARSLRKAVPLKNCLPFIINI